MFSRIFLYVPAVTVAGIIACHMKIPTSFAIKDAMYVQDPTKGRA